jgi:hypothetical protein
LPDDSRPPKLIELPLSHKEESWESVDKGIEEPPRKPPPQRPTRQPSRRWPWVVLILALMAVGYWILAPSAPRIEFDAEGVEFGEQRTGEPSAARTVVLRNRGELPLEVLTIGSVGEAATEFSTQAEDCTGVLIETGAECRVEIAFSPIEMGARQAELEVVANVRGKRALLPLAGEGIAPVLAATPPILDFGTESVDATSPALDIDLGNEGTSPLRIRSVAIGGEGREFAIVGNQCSSTTLAPGETCRVRVVFKPRLMGERSAELAVGSDTHGDPPAIGLVGTGSGPDLEITPAGLDFGTQLVGTSSDTQRLELRNKGNEPFRFASLSLEKAVGIQIAQENCSRRVVAPGDSCSANLRFTPAGEGRVQTSLSIRDAAGGLAPGVSLTGTGIAPQLRLSSSRLDFEGEQVGSTSGARRITISNSGSATLEIAELRVVGSSAAAFLKGRDGCSSVELRPGAECTVELQFRPRVRGDLTARLTARSNVPGEAPGVELRGRGLAPELSMSRSRLDFAAVRETESQDLRVEVLNIGDAPLEVGTLRFRGSAASDFGLAADACSGQTVAASGSCRLIVRFSPTRRGTRDARLVVESNAPGEPVPLILRGSGLEPPEPEIAVAPGALEFGPRAVGERSEVLTLTIRSTGEGRLQIREIRLRGAESDDFRIVAGTCQGLPYVVPGGDCSVGVRFTPGALGERRAALVIEHNAESGESEIPLLGSGV